MMHGPVKVITVERESGSQGGEFAHDLAARLEWRLLDSELVKGAAEAAGVAPELAAKFDERLDPWYYRYGKAFWQDSMYSAAGPTEEQVFDAERMMALVKKEIHEAAQEGNCVLVGRGTRARCNASRDAFMFSCTPRPRPSGSGLRGRFRRRRSTRSRCWLRRTSAERR